ncbi:Ig-like domain-containing protein [Vibrio neptunius]|uniref:Ig-like domain-containing protein n=1 Tax=Vibrio neptunius TaxID=170651 RepID=UPI0019D1E6CD|nr:Ig-like domain-containing protein [Vibrio neptunius]MBN3573563.1 Ig-like domain-containing protein [Vibrio neptunius]
MDKQFNVKDLLLLMTLTLIVLLLSGCGGSEEGASQTESSPPQSTPSSTRPQPSQTEATVQLERLTLTAFPIKTKGTSELTLITGNEQYFLAVGEYSNGQSKLLTEELTVEDWQSSDQTIGEFIQSGVLQSKASGVVSVAFSKDNLTSNRVEVKVTDATITDITITPSVVKLAKGHYQPLTAIAAYNNGLSSDISDSVNWQPNDHSTAKVNTNGLLSGRLVGTTTVTAMKEGITSNPVSVEVTNAVITDITVTPPHVSVAKGQTQAFTATATYSDNTSSDISNSVTWHPVDNRTATVSPSGVLSGGKVGTTTLTAVKDTITSNTVGVVVSDAVITDITVTPPNVSVAKGQTQAFTATANYSDNTSSDISDSVSWRPVDNRTATVTSSGVLSGGNIGTTTLTAVKGGVASNTVNVEVTNAVITDISVTPPTVSIAKGQKQRLTVNATYSDNTSSDISDSVTWIPNDSSIATVSPKGLLAGGKVGTTTLTAVKDNITSNTFGVVVSDAVITDITVTPPNVSVAKGQNQPLAATATYSDNTSSDISDSVSWRPVDNRTATVTSSGVLSGSNIGTTTLTAVKGGVASNTVNVEVTNAVITDITVTPPHVSVAKGQNQPLAATAIYSDNTSSDISDSVSWRPVDNRTATVTSSGVLSGSNIGTTTLTAVKDGVASNTVNVEVTDAVITDITVTPPNVSVAKGQNQPLAATATYSDNTSSDISNSVSWRPVDKRTATVSSSGVLSGGNIGTTTLTAIKDEVASNTVDVEVTNAVLTDITVTPPNVTVAIGQNQALTATAIYSDNTSSDISNSVTWHPIDNRTATITSSGVLSGSNVGATTLTAVKEGVASNTVNVEVTNAVITGISVTPSVVNIAKGQNQALTATATYSDNTSSDISDSVVWRPIDTSTVTVTSNGVLSGSSVGATTLTVVKDNVTSNTVGVVVSDAVITSISVTPSLVSIAKGQNQAMKATAIYSDNTSSDISNSVTWRPADSSTATVTSNGVLSSSNVGTTTLIALKDGVTSNTVNVDVSDAIITGISVTPSVVNIAKGQTHALTATATYSDNTSSDISDSVSWRPVDNRTATVTSSGVLSGGNIGTTTLTAVKDGVASNTIDVEVTNAVITDITVTPPNVTVAKGHNQTATATATYSDNTRSNISDSVTWIPVDRATTTVTPQGLVTGVDVGTTTLTAVKDGVTSNAIDVEVTNAVMTGLTLSPPLIGVVKGQTQAITVTANYSDGTSSDVSNSVTWWIPVTTEMSVTSDGMVTGLNAGSSTIKASKNGFTKSIDVNVCNLDSNGLEGKCIDLFDTGNGKWFTSTPSVAYLDSLGLGGSSHTDGIEAGKFYRFTWTKAIALCTNYNTIKLAGRSNWRLPTLDELKDELYAYYGVSPYIRAKLSSERGWSISRHYWASTLKGLIDNKYKEYWSVYMYNGFRGAYVNSFRFYASCVSEP